MSHPVGRRALGAVLGAALALLLIGLLGPLGATSARAQLGARIDDGPVEVALDGLTPVVPRPRTTLRVSGTVRNTGDSEVSDVEVVLRLGSSPLGTRGELAALAEHRREGDTFPLLPTLTPVTGTLGPGVSVSWALAVKTDALGLSRYGVYPIGVEARGRVAGGELQRLGLTTTFLPFVPKGAHLDPTRIAWVWPLVDRPSRDAEGVFSTDRLAAEVGAGGRLRSLVDAAEGSTVSWVVDPELLESVSAMAGGYDVRNGDGRAAGTGGPAASDWLRRLRSATRSSDLFALPYADPDVVALEHSGLGTDISRAKATGAEVTPRVLDRTATTDLSWPPGGFADEQTLRAMPSRDNRAVLLSGAAMRPVAPLTYTPSGSAVIETPGGDVRALLGDTVITSLLTAPVTAPGAETLARQRFLAETAMVTAELPSVARTVIALPPHRWNPDPSYARSLLDLTGRVPWLAPVTLTQVRDGDPADAARQDPTYPVAARGAELGAGQLDGATRLRRDLTRFAGVLTRPEAYVPAYERAVLRTESGAWRRSPGSGARLLRRVRAQLDEQRRQVRIISKDLVTLSSKTGTVPVTIANDLDQAVVVRLGLSSRNAARLTVADPGERRIEPGRKTTIEVRASARANGIVTVDTRLLTPDGVPYGKVLALRVRATNYGTVGLVITIGALVVLFLAVGVRLVRRALRARRSGAAPAELEPGETVDV